MDHKARREKEGREIPKVASTAFDDPKLKDPALEAAGAIVGSNVANALVHEPDRSAACVESAPSAKRTSVPANSDTGKGAKSPGEEMSGEGSPGLTLDGGGGHA
jgi:hypothetical protein